MLKTTTALAAFTTTIAVTLAAPAHADEQSYLNYLASHGVPAWPAGPGVKAGHDACTALRDGGTPEGFIGRMGAMGALYGQTVVYAAQHELCPDTL